MPSASSVGRQGHPHRRSAVVEEDMNDVPVGEIGEIVLPRTDI